MLKKVAAAWAAPVEARVGGEPPRRRPWLRFSRGERSRTSSRRHGPGRGPRALEHPAVADLDGVGAACPVCGQVMVLRAVVRGPETGRVLAGLERAARENIPTSVVNHRDYDSREEFDLALQKAIDESQPDLVVLAGFMRILGPQFVKAYAGRILNIHPSLLPKYPGINTHQRALDAKDKEHGVSIHFVTEELDGGPVIAQDRVSVLKEDTADTLAERVLGKEHLLYPKVVSWFAAGRLGLAGNQAYLDGEVLPHGGIQVHP